MMKIALVYDAIYPFIKGGGEKRFYEIGKRLSRKGHEVHFYGMKFWEGKDTIKKEGMYFHGICKAKQLYNKEGKRSIIEAIYFGFHTLKLRREDIDLLDCCAFPYFPLFFCKLISIIKKKPLYSNWYEVWGKDYWYEYIGWKGYFGYIIEKLAVLLPDRIISSSYHTTRKLKNELNCKKPIHTILNGIEYDIITKIEPAKEETDIIFAGRLVSHKNIDLLIKSIGTIKRKNPTIRLTIIGEGPEKKSLELLTEKLDLKKNIQFLGFLESPDDVYALMKSSKVFVLPSVREGFGIVVIEANACGIPVITIDHKNNAAKDLIEEGKNGFVCELSEKEITKRIMETLENNSFQKIQKNCIELSKKFDWNRIIDEIEGVYLK